ncbi:MAG TPA: hypothetical protein VK172_14670 [Lentimicrobium sp.]|nr:hypothetical protein [Bacteroidales bacterium]HLO92405.1 hypothetical protein [Lentimicrobium sp.]
MTARNVLKTWFETGDKPSQAQFAELIDSLFHRDEDVLSIEKISGLQDALNNKANVESVIAPIELQNAVSGYLVIGDITLCYTIRIEYVIVRGDLYEMGVIRVDNRANSILIQDSDLDVTGFIFGKEITGNDLRLTWSDNLANQIDGLLYITDIRKTLIQN